MKHCGAAAPAITGVINASPTGQSANACLPHAARSLLYLTVGGGKRKAPAAAFCFFRSSNWVMFDEEPGRRSCKMSPAKYRREEMVLGAVGKGGGGGGVWWSE